MAVSTGNALIINIQTIVVTNEVLLFMFRKRNNT